MWKLIKRKLQIKLKRNTIKKHGLKADDIGASALKIIETLQQSGFEAYVVGGGVRDRLVGLHPKDFDVATNATPEEVRKIFKNCRLIGKRFRLAHIYFHRHIIEVATFRGNPTANSPAAVATEPTT